MAITVNATPTKGYKYIPLSERESEQPFTVYIRPLITRDLLDLEDRMIQRKGEEVMVAQGIFSFRIAQQGIIAWENILDEEGKQVTLNSTLDGTPDDGSIGKIPVEYLLEISSVISAITRDPANIQIFFSE